MSPVWCQPCRDASCVAAGFYAIFDGLFQQGLLKHLSGDTDAARDLQERAEYLMGKLILSS
jgi:hypothetical protein